MAEAIYFDEGVLTLTTSEDTSTEFNPVGVQDITITPSFDISRLYTGDSTFIESQKQANHEISVEIGYSKFDMDFAQQWLGGAGSSATASTDTVDPQKFELTVVTSSADGTFERTAKVIGITFEEFEVLNGSQGEFEEFSLSGTGEELSDFSDTSGA